MAKYKMSDLKSMGKSGGAKSTAAASQALNVQLKQAGEELKRILTRKVQEYYNSYEPQVYIRTNEMIKSIRLSPVEIKGTKAQIKVYFDEGSIHPSVMGGEPGWTGTLIGEGWKWKDQSKPIYRFTYFEGTDWFDESIKEFNQINKWGFTVYKNVY